MTVKDDLIALQKMLKDHQTAAAQLWVAQHQAQDALVAKILGELGTGMFDDGLFQ